MPHYIMWQISNRCALNHSKPCIALIAMCHIWHCLYTHVSNTNQYSICKILTLCVMKRHLQTLEGAKLPDTIEWYILSLYVSSESLINYRYTTRVEYDYNQVVLSALIEIGKGKEEWTWYIVWGNNCNETMIKQNTKIDSEHYLWRTCSEGGGRFIKIALMHMQSFYDSWQECKRLHSS